VVPVGVRANIELADEEGDTPLHYAAFGNQPEVIELLVQRRANMNVVNKAHCTPLHVVVNIQQAVCRLYEGAVAPRSRLERPGKNSEATASSSWSRDANFSFQNYCRMFAKTNVQAK
jgi:ankyrin repeat protein